MIIPDANLLLYSVDKESPDHAKSAAWWRAALHGSQEVGLCAVVAFAFLRLATNRKVFLHPLTVKDAGARIANWLEFPNIVWLDTPNARTWRRRSVCCCRRGARERTS